MEELSLYLGFLVMRKVALGLVLSLYCMKKVGAPLFFGFYVMARFSWRCDARVPLVLGF